MSLRMLHCMKRKLIYSTVGAITGSCSARRGQPLHHAEQLNCRRLPFRTPYRWSAWQFVHRQLGGQVLLSARSALRCAMRPSSVLPRLRSSTSARSRNRATPPPPLGLGRLNLMACFAGQSCVQYNLGKKNPTFGRVGLFATRRLAARHGPVRPVPGPEQRLQDRDGRLLPGIRNASERAFVAHGSQPGSAALPG